MSEKSHDGDEFSTRVAVEMMRREGLGVTEKAYGFELIHGSTFGQCGSEHNGSVSISIRESKTVLWFQRFSMGEMARFLIQAIEDCEAEGVALTQSLEKLDSQFDHDELARKLRSAYPDLYRLMDGATHNVKNPGEARDK